jgi:hypothetical protein
MIPAANPASLLGGSLAMKRMRVLLAGLVLVGVGGRAGACMNDSELKTHEREFRSQYGEWAGVAPAELEGGKRRALRQEFVLAAGAVMLVGAFGLAVRRDRSGA